MIMKMIIFVMKMVMLIIIFIMTGFLNEGLIFLGCKKCHARIILLNTGLFIRLLDLDVYAVFR